MPQAPPVALLIPGIRATSVELLGVISATDPGKNMGSAAPVARAAIVGLHCCQLEELARGNDSLSRNQGGPMMLQEFETLGGTMAVGLVVITVLIWQRNHDRKELQRFVASCVRGGETARVAVFRLASQIYDLPHTVDDPIWTCRVFAAFGATPGAILKAGACCSGKTRLLILSLAELGIPAYQITLYHKEGHAQHCLAEVCVDKERFLVDPLYGISLTDSEGRGVSLKDLQCGIQPSQVPFTLRTDWGYPNDPYYDFDYSASKTANWTRSSLRRAAYLILHRASRGAVDHLIVPTWFEWPQNLGIVACATLLSLVAIASI